MADLLAGLVYGHDGLHHHAFGDQVVPLPVPSLSVLRGDMERLAVVPGPELVRRGVVVVESDGEAGLLERGQGVLEGGRAVHVGDGDVVHDAVGLLSDGLAGMALQPFRLHEVARPVELGGVARVRADEHFADVPGLQQACVAQRGTSPRAEHGRVQHALEPVVQLAPVGAFPGQQAGPLRLHLLDLRGLQPRLLGLFGLAFPLLLLYVRAQ